LAERYPDIAAAAEVEWLFDPSRSVDLYFDIVYKHTDWPTYNYSIKTLATHLGFKWRDENPSGAASIQWYNDWCETKNPKVLQRILDYNEDDCKAMTVLLDCLRPLAAPG
jgi:predicted RecB family nuclease